MGDAKNYIPKWHLISIGLILVAGIVFAIGVVQPLAESEALHHEVLAALVVEEEEVQMSRAERVARALVQAYPRRVLKAEYRNGDWAVLLRDTWFYYAEGRLLPYELRYRIDQYRPIAFYDNYPRELPPWTPPTQEQISRFQAMVADRTGALSRAPHFFDTLYRARSHAESYSRMKTIRFLGRNVTVHHAILEEVALVEYRIREKSRTDRSVLTWIYNIDRIYGWHWRNVGGTQTRSFHAYGVAIDIIPRNLGGRAVYWRWTGPNWFNVPHERRHHPPDGVILAFQERGFVWGGKWPFFDTIHFEFRPEVMILNGIEMSTLR
ncbi:MAG: M15 family metallopeptidase [Treponema sp.]|nr:M15 family metallopeptidase [Treponema sp.]